MRNPFTYLRELSDDLKRAQDRLVQEILRSDKAQKELAEAKAKIAEQRKAYEFISEPANLEEQALKLCGKLSDRSTH